MKLHCRLVGVFYSRARVYYLVVKDGGVSNLGDASSVSRRAEVAILNVFVVV